MAEPETPELARAAVEGGADIGELGFPFAADEPRGACPQARLRAAVCGLRHLDARARAVGRRARGRNRRRLARAPGRRGRTGRAARVRRVAARRARFLALSHAPLTPRSS